MTDIGDGWRPRKGQRDIYGNEIPDRIYTNSDYDYNIIIEDRIQQVAAEITSYLKSTDSMSKTIVFCANEDAAERMRMALINCNADMVKKNPDYVVRITGSDAYGKSKLKYFISTSSEGPVIATTSELLSTGADCKMVKLIVLDKMIGDIEPSSDKLPVLLKKYISLNAKIIGFNIDPKFSMCLDGLLILDIFDVPMKTIESLSKEINDDTILSRFSSDSVEL